MSREVAYEEMYRGYTVKLVHDSDPRDPREWDNLGTMVCWHRRYNLGNTKESENYSDAEEFFYSLAGFHIDDYEYRWNGEEKCDEFLYGNKWLTSDEIVQKAMDKAQEKNLILPLYLYDHSRISMSTGRSYPFNCRWDSMQVGWIYVSYEKLRKEYGWKRITPARREKAYKYLEGEVETYDSYLTGDVYGFVVEKDGDYIDSCWGYFGWSEREYPLEEARAVVDAVIKQNVQEHAKKVKNWIANKVPFQYRVALQM